MYMGVIDVTGFQTLAQAYSGRPTKCDGVGFLHIFRRNSREKTLLSLDAGMDSRAPPSAGDVAAATTFLRAAALRFLRSGTASACTDDEPASARASSSLRRCPADTAEAPPTSTVSRPSGNPSSHGPSPLRTSASRSSVSVASPRATSRLSRIVVANRWDDYSARLPGAQVKLFESSEPVWTGVVGGEIKRLQKERGLVAGRLDKLVKKTEAKDYATKCPAATQEEDRTKVAEMNGEIASLDAAIAAFEAGAD